MLIFTWGLFMYLLIFNILTTEETKGKYQIVVFLLIILLVLSHILKKVWIPKYYNCMRVVKKYLNYRELKAILAEQELKQIEFNLSGNKWGISNLYISDKWICVDDIYIPRNMISDLIRYSPGILTGYVQLYFLCKNGMLINLGKISTVLLEGVMKDIKREIPELMFDNSLAQSVFQSSILKEMKREFTSIINSKQDFIEFIIK